LVGAIELKITPPLQPGRRGFLSRFRIQPISMRENGAITADEASVLPKLPDDWHQNALIL
jgi:hypothetical protein